MAHDLTTSDVDFIHASLVSAGFDVDKGGAEQVWREHSHARNCDWVRVSNYGVQDIVSVGARSGLRRH